MSLTKKNIKVGGGLERWRRKKKKIDTEGLHRLLGQLKREIVNVSRRSSG
jgi:hypothetical protein